VSVTLLILAGLPGSGKSTLAATLAERLGWQRVDRDAIRAAMFPACDFSDAEKDAATESAWLAAETHLVARRSCIVDGMTFATRRARERARELADLNAARFRALLLDVPVDVALARVRADRTHPAGDRDAALVRDVAARFEAVEEDCERLDATVSPHAVAERALALLATPASAASR
jgi:predicted kinase